MMNLRELKVLVGKETGYPLQNLKDVLSFETALLEVFC